MLQLAIKSLTQPRASIAKVLRYDIENALLYQAAIVLACLSGILDPVIGTLVSGEFSTVGDPLLLAAFQFVAIIVTAVAIFWIGGRFGGIGDYNGALKVSVWYGVVSILPSIAIVFFQASGSSLGGVVQFGVLFWMLFIISNFILVLHGFRNLFMTILGVVGSSIIIGMVSLMVLSMFGLIPGGAI